MRLFALSLLSGLSLFAGCAAKYPELVPKWNEMALDEFEERGTNGRPTFRTKYDKSVSEAPPNWAAATAERDRILTSLVGLVDTFHRETEYTITAGRATSNLALDAAQLTLNGLGAVTGGEAVKAALAAAAAGVTGFQASLSAEVYAEKTNGAILTAMQTIWNTNRSIIEAGMKLPASRYSLDQGIMDWSRFAIEGSFSDALGSLQDGASVTKKAEATKADKRIKDAVAEGIKIQSDKPD